MKSFKILYRIKKQGLSFFLTLGAMILLVACNKEFPFRIDLGHQQPDEERDIKAKSYKIAYLVLEDGVGNIVAQEASGFGSMPTLAELSQTALVSWNGVSALNSQELTTYADLLTGVEYNKHLVEDGASSNNLEEYPSIFKRISQNSNMKTAFISSNANLTALVGESDVDSYSISSDDDEVTEKVLEELSKEDIGLVFATFNEAKITGEDKGYDSEEYVDALGSFDQKLKEITEAIYAREAYDNEKWLIVVTSNKGGHYTLPVDQQDGTVFANTDRNNFVIASNPEFSQRSVERIQTEDPAWTTSAVRYTGSGGKATISSSDASIYNLANNKEFTIQLKVKFHGFGRQNQTIFSKRSSTSGGEVGWAVMVGQDSNGDSKGAFRFKVAGTEVYATAPLEKDVWYSVIVRVYIEDGKQYATVFRNGVEYNTGDITNANGVSNEPLQLGYASGWAASVGDQSHTIADVRIYDVAKPISEIQSSYCSTLATPGSDPYYDDLIGYWPANDDKAEIKDMSPSGRSFFLEGSYAWTDISDRGGSICPTPPDNLERLVIRSVDIPRLIYNWAGFMNVDEFDLDSQVWNPVFSN